MRIAFIANTIIETDAIGKYSLYIFKVLKKEADFEIFLEKDNRSQTLKDRSHNWFFFRGCPLLLWYFIEWKLGRRLASIERIFVEPFRRRYFKKLAKKFLAYDYVWLEFGLYFNGIYLLAELSKLKNRPKIIFDYHGITPPDYIDARGKKMIARRSQQEIKLALDAADLCLVRSDFMAAELATFSRPKKIIKLPLPIEKIEFSQEFNRKSNPPILLFVGRVARHKNLEILLTAVSLLKQEKVNFKLEIIGSFSRSSLAEERNRLELICRNLEINQQVKFRGEVSQKELKKFYQSSFALVIPSLHEGFAWPAIEAMGYGLPVIASSAGALPETIGQAGLLFNPRDPKELKDKIMSLVNNKKLYQDLQIKGLKRIEEFSYVRFRDSLLNIIDNKW